MTHDILQSDIELATRLRDDHRPDGEIIQALVYRGVDPGKAAQLVDDLRNGKRVAAQSPLPQEFGLRRRSRGQRSSPATEQEPPARPPAEEPPSEPPLEPAVPDRKSPRPLRWVIAGLVGLGFVVAVIVLFQRNQAGSVSPDQTPPPATAPKPDRTPPKAAAKPVTATPQAATTRMALELQPDGLHIGGSLVTRDNLLPAVANLLGVPTRTNQVAQTGTVIYAYDHEGVLIYSQPGGGTNSIVLDCDATGGINGTTSPFAGLLKMEDRVIGPDMDSAALAAIKELGLKHPGTGGSIWNGRYHSLELVFAYLKSPQRLSLIEIDLK